MTSGVAKFYDGKSKYCGDCFEIKPVTEFSLTSTWSDSTPGDPELPSGAYRSKCKKCKSQYCIGLQRRKKMEQYPGLYWECDGCDGLNHKRLNKCSKCGDEKPTEYK